MSIPPVAVEQSVEGDALVARVRVGDDARGHALRLSVDDARRFGGRIIAAAEEANAAILAFAAASAAERRRALLEERLYRRAEAWVLADQAGDPLGGLRDRWDDILGFLRAALPATQVDALVAAVRARIEAAYGAEPRDDLWPTA